MIGAMDALAWVPPIRQAHLAFVALSGSLFALRGAAVLAGARWPLRSGWRIASVVIDTLLFGAGLTLWAVLSLNPLRDHWLAAKLLLLVLYVVLGTWALKRARRTGTRAFAFAAALLVFATMLGIGWLRDPLGFWRGLLT
jgi:uncharacterized membrane protein SirB2